MVVVHRAHGLRFIIYIDDHAPPHVHVRDGHGEAKVLLVDAEGKPEILRASQMTRASLRRMMREIGEHQAMLLQRWSEIHG